MEFSNDHDVEMYEIEVTKIGQNKPLFLTVSVNMITEIESQVPHCTVVKCFRSLLCRGA